METQVEVWENEKLQSEHKPIGLVFPRYFVAAKVVVIVIVIFIARFNTGLCCLRLLRVRFLDRF